MAAIGIDFGSLNTTISWEDSVTRQPKICVIPSKIIIHKHIVFCGFEAEKLLEHALLLLTHEQLKSFLGNAILSFDKLVDGSEYEYFDGEAYTQKRLMRHFLSYVIDYVTKEEFGKSCHDQYKIDVIRFSFPICFSEKNVNFLKSLFLEMGFNDVEGQQEPIIAVKGYAHDHKLPHNANILVFDFGGKSTDVSLVTIKDEQISIRTKPQSNDSCGGLYLDSLFYEHFCCELKKQYGVDVTQYCATDFLLLEQCRQLKEHFPNQDSITYYVSVNDKRQQYQLSLNKDAFNQIISSNVNNAIDVAKKVITELNTKNVSIDRVLLIGGSSKLPLVKERIKEYLPNVPIEVSLGQCDFVPLGNLYVPKKEEPPTPRSVEIVKPKQIIY